MKYVIVSIIAGLLFVACTEEQGGTQMTESGYQYQLLEDAEGELPEPGDHVFVHTTVRAEDTVLYESRNNPGRPSPVTIPAEGQAVQGNLAPVQDVLSFASIGDSIRLIYPVDSFQTIPPTLRDYADVYYDMKVTDIMNPADYEAWRQAQRDEANARAAKVQSREAGVAARVQQTYEDYKAGELEGQITRTESGLGYIIHDEGREGTAVPKGEIVRAHYYGVLGETGEVFDNSFRKGRTFDFNVGLGGAIPGWDEAFQILNKGASATLFVPGHLAYGERGFGDQIPPNAELIFYVEHVDDEQ